jgi:segregation and condensation protein B
MAFNLKLVLKALLFSSSQPLTIKEIQAVFGRYHDQAQPAAASSEVMAEEVVEDGGTPEAPASTAEEVDPLGLAPVDEELYVEVPSLVTAAQIREAMDALAEELKAQNDIYLLIDGAQGYRLVTHPRFAKWIRILRDEPPPVSRQTELHLLARRHMRPSNLPLKKEVMPPSGLGGASDEYFSPDRENQ